MDNPRPADQDEREAMRLIAEIYARISEVRDRDLQPTKVVLPPRAYRLVQAYRARLGEVAGDLPDYLGRYELFGVPIYSDTTDRIVIEAGHPARGG